MWYYQISSLCLSVDYLLVSWWWFYFGDVLQWLSWCQFVLIYLCVDDNDNILPKATFESAMPHSNYCSSKYLEPLYLPQNIVKWFFLAKNNYKKRIHIFLISTVYLQPFCNIHNILYPNQYFNMQCLISKMLFQISRAFCFLKNMIQIRFEVKSQES